MSTKQIAWLFLFSLVGTLVVYAIFLGKVKTIFILLDSFLWIVVAIFLLLGVWFYKRKLQGVEVIDFHRKNNLTFQSTLMIFFAIEVIDYILEDGFIGMISQWCLYWIMGFVVFLLFTIINYRKNITYYKDVLTHDEKYDQYSLMADRNRL